MVSTRDRNAANQYSDVLGWDWFTAVCVVCDRRGTRGFMGLIGSNPHNGRSFGMGDWRWLYLDSRLGTTRGYDKNRAWEHTHFARLGFRQIFDSEHDLPVRPRCREAKHQLKVLSDSDIKALISGARARGSDTIVIPE